MRSSTICSLAFMTCIASLLPGCCVVPTAGGCGGCGIASSCNTACPGILHGQLAARMRNAMTGGCCSGCGEVYYDEQINEPPTCDPCSGNGEFTGASCGPCRPLFERLRDLWCAPPCGTSCSGCDSCGSDMYAADSGHGGYCSNCRDGVAGNPVHQGHSHAQHLPTPAMPRSSSSSSKLTPAPALEPVPDPMSDVPSSTTPVRVERSSTSGSKPARAIHVPAHQAKHTRSASR